MTMREKIDNEIDSDRRRNPQESAADREATSRGRLERARRRGRMRAANQIKQHKLRQRLSPTDPRAVAEAEYVPPAPLPLELPAGLLTPDCLEALGRFAAPQRNLHKELFAPELAEQWRQQHNRMSEEARIFHRALLRFRAAAARAERAGLFEEMLEYPPNRGQSQWIPYWESVERLTGSICDQEDLALLSSVLSDSPFERAGKRGRPRDTFAYWIVEGTALRLSKAGAAISRTRGALFETVIRAMFRAVEVPAPDDMYAYLDYGVEFATAYQRELSRVQKKLTPVHDR